MASHPTLPRFVVETSPIRALAAVMAGDGGRDRHRRGSRSIAIIARPIADHEREAIASVFARFAPACELWGVQNGQKPALMLIRSGRTEQIAVDPGTLKQHSRTLRLVRPDDHQVIEGKPLVNRRPTVCGSDGAR